MFGRKEEPKRITLIPAKIELKRHRRKYAAGELDEDKSFYFRGPGEKMKLRAQNLKTFIQLAQGVDEETWEYHRKKQEYSKWIRETVKDEGVAEEIAKVEEDVNFSAEKSKARIIKAIEEHYTAPA